jgi:hypothetical protein
VKTGYGFESHHRHPLSGAGRVNRLAAIGTNPDALGVVDSMVARTTVRAQRKHSSAPAADLAFFRSRILRNFVTLVFLSHTFLIRLRRVGLQRITGKIASSIRIKCHPPVRNENIAPGLRFSFNHVCFGRIAGRGI